MNRDNILFVVIGLLVGFIAGYLLHEVMAARQPPRRLPGRGLAQATTAPSPGVQPAMPNLDQINQLRRYVAENPEDAEAVRSLANLNFDIQNWERARDLYEQVLKLQPENADVLTDLGVCYRQMNQSERALELFNRARSLAADHWQSRFNAAIVLVFDMNDLSAAEKMLEELRRLQPDNSSVEQLAAEIARRRDAA